MTQYVVFALISAASFWIYLLFLHLMHGQEFEYYRKKSFITNMEVVYCVVIASTPLINVIAAVIAIVAILIFLCTKLSDSGWAQKPFFKQK